MKATRIGITALAFTIGLGFSFYQKSSTAKEIQKDMLNFCSTDNDCQNAVNTYFKKCFDISYSGGSRRRRSSLDARKLSECINNSSGIAYFKSQ